MFGGRRRAARLENRVEARIDVEVAGRASGALLGHPTDAAAAGGAHTGDVDDHATREPTRQRPQALVGGTREVGEQRQGGVGVLVHRAFERVLVELAHLG